MKLGETGERSHFLKTISNNTKPPQVIGISDPLGGYLFMILFAVFPCTGPSTALLFAISTFIFVFMLFIPLSDVATIAVKFLCFFDVPFNFLQQNPFFDLGLGTFKDDG